MARKVPTKKELVARHDSVVRASRADVRALADVKGVRAVRDLLRAAHDDLNDRLDATLLRGDTEETFTQAALRASIAQVRDVSRDLVGDLRAQLVGQAVEGGEMVGSSVYETLMRADEAFGLGNQPLPITEAAMLDAGVRGAHATVLRRLAPDPETGIGILQRYGMETVKDFEKRLQIGVLTGKSRAEMADDITEASPFLQGAPRFWAERIVRTEVMGATNAGHLEAIHEADDALGDMVKILCAADDDRTEWDSLAVHGQIRRPNEPFEWFDYKGRKKLYMHPPNRPNDRETVTPHRVAWEIPDALRAFPDAVYRAKWRESYPHRPPPRRPLMTTVPIDHFGEKAEEEKPEQKPVDAPETQPATRHSRLDAAVDKANAIGVRNMNFLREGMRDLSTHRGAYEGASPEEVEEIAAGRAPARNTGKILPPIKITHDSGDMILEDGRHRMTAAIEAGASEISAVVHAYTKSGKKISREAIVSLHGKKR